MKPQEQNKQIESRLKNESPEKILNDLIELNKKEIKELDKIKKMTKPIFDEHEKDMELFEENNYIILSDLISKSSRIFRQKSAREAIIWLTENFEIIPKEPILKKYRK